MVCLCLDKQRQTKTNKNTLKTHCVECCLQIVLLNLLVVMMREVYREVRSLEKDVFLRSRARLIVEVETLMTQKKKSMYSMMPPYLHLLSQVCIVYLCVCVCPV